MNFRVFVGPELYITCIKWCEEEFGNERVDYSTWQALGNNELGADFYFENEEDAIAFKLRWV